MRGEDWHEDDVYEVCEIIEKERLIVRGRVHITAINCYKHERKNAASTEDVRHHSCHSHTKNNNAEQWFNLNAAYSWALFVIYAAHLSAPSLTCFNPYLAAPVLPCSMPYHFKGTNLKMHMCFHGSNL